MTVDMTVVNFMFGQIQNEIDAIQSQLDVTSQKGERSETVGGFQSFAYTNRPLAVGGGMQPNNTPLPSNTVYVDIIFIYDARKSGEGVGSGTGVPCYYDPTVDDWRRFEDNAIVTV